ncbi:MAG: hypothetical protein AAFR97_13370, partial [Bacteroidota bacterium]
MSKTNLTIFFMVTANATFGRATKTNPGEPGAFEWVVRYNVLSLPGSPSQGRFANRPYRYDG